MRWDSPPCPAHLSHTPLILHAVPSLARHKDTRWGQIGGTTISSVPMSHPSSHQLLRSKGSCPTILQLGAEADSAHSQAAAPPACPPGSQWRPGHYWAHRRPHSTSAHWPLQGCGEAYLDQGGRGFPVSSPDCQGVQLSRGCWGRSVRLWCARRGGTLQKQGRLGRSNPPSGTGLLLPRGGCPL